LLLDTKRQEQYTVIKRLERIEDEKDHAILIKLDTIKFFAINDNILLQL